MKKELLSIVLMIAAPCAHGAPRAAEPPARDRIRGLLAADSKWNKAVEAADAAALEAMTTEDFSCISYDGRVVGRAELLGSYRKMTPEQRAAHAARRLSRSRTLVSSRVYGNAGILVVRNKSGESEGIATAVWVMTNGQWKLAGCHASHIPRDEGRAAGAEKSVTAELVARGTHLDTGGRITQDGRIEGGKKSGLLIVSTTGGSLRMLDPDALPGYTFSPDSKRLLYARSVKRADGEGTENEMFWVSVEGGVPQAMGVRMPGACAPSLNADGTRILFSAAETLN